MTYIDLCYWCASYRSVGDVILVEITRGTYNPEFICEECLALRVLAHTTTDGR